MGVRVGRGACWHGDSIQSLPAQLSCPLLLAFLFSDSQILYPDAIAMVINSNKVRQPIPYVIGYVTIELVQGADNRLGLSLLFV